MINSLARAGPGRSDASIGGGARSRAKATSVGRTELAKWNAVNDFMHVLSTPSLVLTRPLCLEHLLRRDFRAVLHLPSHVVIHSVIRYQSTCTDLLPLYHEDSISACDAPIPTLMTCQTLSRPKNRAVKTYSGIHDNENNNGPQTVGGSTRHITSLVSVKDFSVLCEKLSSRRKRDMLSGTHFLYHKLTRS